MADSNTLDEKYTNLRQQIRACILEYAEDSKESDVLQSDSSEQPPEQHVAKGGLMVSNKPDMTLQSTIVEIAKSAAYGMERIELLKKRDFPTHKSADAVGMAVDALEMIFKDMLRNPMNYLDEDPVEKVAEYEQYLDDEAAKLDKV
jgi:hypothetical protein